MSSFDAGSRPLGSYNYGAMEFGYLHDWDLTPEAAIALQRELAGRVRLSDEGGPVATIAGVDVSFPEGGEVTQAAVVLVGYPDFEVRAQVVVEEPTRFPYIPGLLSFRETPTILEAFRHLDTPPDLVIVDGQGIAHPRRFGIASHLGLWLDRPAIGCAKSRLTGYHRPVGPEPGDYADLTVAGGTVIGAALRTRRGANPLYVSPGHRIGVVAAREWVLACARGYRLPEPTRLAHRAAARVPMAPPASNLQPSLFGANDGYESTS
jgi:deoxyribonuclease V